MIFGEANIAAKMATPLVAAKVPQNTAVTSDPWVSGAQVSHFLYFIFSNSVPKIMFLVPENEKRNKFYSFLPKTT